MAACKEAEAKHLTIMTGAQRRYQQEYQETIDRIKDGAIGEILSTEAHWEGTPVIQQTARNPKWSDSEWQHRAWYSHLWICGDQIVEQHLHNIDVINWVMGMHPIKVTAMGGAAWRPREEVSATSTTTTPRSSTIERCADAELFAPIPESAGL